MKMLCNKVGIVGVRLCKYVDRYRNYNLLKYFSTQQKPVITLENIFGDENKERVKKSLLSVPPVRTVEQLTSESTVNTPDDHNSAILIPLCHVDNKPSILYTLRSMNLKRHRGQVCFPGGKRDEGDSDLAFTAVRETEEELGLPHDTVDVWGSLIPIPNRGSGKTFTTPVLAYCGHIDINLLTPNQQEVEDIFTRTIESLVDLDNIRITRWRTGRGFKMPVYLGGEHRIWGLTAIATHQALTLIAPGLYKYKIRFFS